MGEQGRGAGGPRTTPQALGNLELSLQERVQRNGGPRVRVAEALGAGSRAKVERMQNQEPARAQTLAGWKPASSPTGRGEC